MIIYGENESFSTSYPLYPHVHKLESVDKPL